MMKLSKFGKKYSRRSGIVELMEDLGEALQVNPDLISMGGGNPGRIAGVESVLQRHLQTICEDSEKFYQLLGRYQAPQGDPELIALMVDFLNVEFGWQLGKGNIAISNGGQSAFYILFNMFAGRNPDESKSYIQLPLTPEYLGYTDAGLEDEFFKSSIPRIEIIEDHIFKYRVDFDTLEISAGAGALCVSRPTNPTGNVLTNEEISQLDLLASARNIPFIIDGAYGSPFPNIIFTEVTPHWNPNTILLLSLSKLGLPGARTGFVIAREEIISAFKTANTILNLASGNLGPALACELFRNNEILSLSRDHIMPWYYDRAMQCLEWLRYELGDLPYFIHKPEGAIFLWLWLPELPISSQELYLRLKKVGVLVIPGQNCFPGLREDWSHRHQCLRISYAQDKDQVHKGIKILARELRQLHE